VTRSKWKLTQEAKIDEWGEERLRFGRQDLSPLEALAEDPRNGLIEIHPGVYIGRKAP
jgi:hypothetical protein